MSSGEYQALMREMASKPPSGSSSFSFSGGNNNGAAKTNNSNDVMVGEITLRLDVKWERFVANLAVQMLELGKQVVQSIQIVAYAASACLVLYGVSCVIRALRDNDNQNYGKSSDTNKTDKSSPP
eukprot:scaffold2050_cov167-Amphora_coffeaeformis.AAC.4